MPTISHSLLFLPPPQIILVGTVHHAASAKQHEEPDHRLQAHLKVSSVSVAIISACIYSNYTQNE